MLDVAITPAQLRPAEITVVIDVLRATSTATQALAAGYRRVLCTDSIERALGLREPRRVLAGERQCVMPPGFDQGNSPAEAALLRGDEMVLATTNGAPAIAAAALQSGVALLACMLNLNAVVGVLRAAGEQDVQVVCSGTDGAVALEDVYVAGRICAALPGPRTDAALVAEGLMRGYDGPLSAFAASADARVLRAACLEDDIAYCAQDSLLEIVPTASFEAEGVASVVAAPRVERRGPQAAGD